MKPYRPFFMFMICLLIVTTVLLSCAKPKYTLSTSCVPAQGGTISPLGGIYEAGTEVTLIATPAQYYKFDGWGGDGGLVNKCVNVRQRRAPLPV